MFANSQGLLQSGAPEGKKRVEDKLTCLPVTIRSIENALHQSGGGDLKFYGQEMGMLILVAQVETLVKQNASCEMMLNDSTGRIKARYYTDAESLDALVPGKYVNIFGNVRTAPATHFAITGLQIVQHADEISFHMIETAHAHLKLQQGHMDPATPSPKKFLETKSPSGAGAMETPAKADDAPATTAPVSVAAPSPAMAPAAVQAPPAKMPSGDELKASKDAVLQAVQELAKGEEGTGMENLLTRFPAQETEVRAFLSALVEEGEIFTTTDENHWNVV